MYHFSVPACVCTRTQYAHDQTGIQHHLMASFCRCEDEVITLLRMKLWPATPQQPSLAFQFQLLDSYESLLLECQEALRNFVTALEVNLPCYEKLRKDTVSYLFMHVVRRSKKECTK